MMLNQPWKRQSPTKSPRKSPTKHNSPSRRTNNNKIQHQIENDGCRCAICLRLAIENMNIMKKQMPNDIIQEKKQFNYKKLMEPFYIKYLLHYYMLDRGYRRLRLMIPEICVFDKGAPQYMLTKKKDQQQLKLIRNKEKLNFYEVKNFFYEGFVYHNRQIDNSCAQKPSKSVTFEIRDKEALKNECIVLARYSNNPGQLMSPSMMDNLFKSSQRNFRSALLYMQTIVNSKCYQQKKIVVDMDVLKDQQLMQRAKNQIKIMNNEVKSNELNFIVERDQIQYEEKLKKVGFKKYLEYIGLKLLLLHSYKSDKCIEEATFKFAKGTFGDYYYFVDLVVHRYCDREKIWGILILDENVQESAEKKLTLKQQTEEKYWHLQNNPTIVALEQIMYNTYLNKKEEFFGKEVLTERKNVKKEEIDLTNVQNTIPEAKTFRITRGRVNSHRASLHMAL